MNVRYRVELSQAERCELTAMFRRYTYKDNRYEEFIVPGPAWQVVSREFPKLDTLQPNHGFIDAITALIDSYIDGSPRASVSI
jgi:hypothetical protein